MKIDVIFGITGIMLAIGIIMLSFGAINSPKADDNPNELAHGCELVDSRPDLTVYRCTVRGMPCLYAVSGFGPTRTGGFTCNWELYDGD